MSSSIRLKTAAQNSPIHSICPASTLSTPFFSEHRGRRCKPWPGRFFPCSLTFFQVDLSGHFLPPKLISHQSNNCSRRPRLIDQSSELLGRGSTALLHSSPNSNQSCQLGRAGLSRYHMHKSPPAFLFISREHLAFYLLLKIMSWESGRHLGEK